MSVARFVAAAAVVVHCASFVGAAQLVPAGPRLRAGSVPSQMAPAVGGGEVILELAVDASGMVRRVVPLRVTPPFTEQFADAAARWTFEPARTVIEKRPTQVEGAVLVVALIRPPTMYAGPSLGTPPQTVAQPSPRVPQFVTLKDAAYPPVAIGSAIVLVEIEMNRRGEPRAYRIVGPPSGFDSAALAAVRDWRFTPPTAADAPELLFVYAVVGFREPVASTRPRG